jgi:predicted  nucleic acid-binding Zn-ribbon protein
MPTTPMSRRNTASGHRPSISLSGSPLSARSSVKTRPQTDNETELEAAAMLEDIRTRLAKSESAAEAAAQEYSLQVKALQLRLDEAQKDYAKVEEQMHSKEDSIENMQIQIKELTRSKRDQENIYEAEVPFFCEAAWRRTVSLTGKIENCRSTR